MTSAMYALHGFVSLLVLSDYCGQSNTPECYVIEIMLDCVKVETGTG